MSEAETVSISTDLLDLVSEEADRWLNSLLPEELACFAGQYIAVRKKKVIAADSSLGRLYKKLEDQGLKYRVRVRYIEEPDGVVIY